MEIQYIGEHLIWGQLGHVFTILSFCGALLSALAYGYSTAEQNLNEQQNWKKLARRGFYTHSLSVIGIIACLFWMLFNHYFEYHYVWQHSNSAMPMQYILSCFWEGQEGSFLLWTFWNMVLGNLLMRTAKDWEPHSMAIVAMVNAFWPQCF